MRLRGLRDWRGQNLDSSQPRPAAYVEGLWGFWLSEQPGGQTRLVISGYQTIRPRWIGRFVLYWLYVPVTWIMQARMLALLKRFIEREGQGRLLEVGENRPVDSKTAAAPA